MLRNAILSVLCVVCCGVLYAQQPDFDAKMSEYGLVDIRTLNSDILVELKYSTEDNFVEVDMYGTLETAYLEAAFAQKVVDAQLILKRRNPKLTLLIYDAARPISVQRRMRSVVEGTPYEGFVADGTRGGRHNYGVAVDLTIATTDGVPLDMGAGFDDFTSAAAVKGTSDTKDPANRKIEVYRAYAQDMARRGVISQRAADNRMLLLEVMCEAGLLPYRNEWWHYEEPISMSVTRQKYKLLDF